MSGDNPRFDAPLPDLWDDAHAAALDEPGLLLYRSNLLGSDLRITNFGGGNTSAKLAAADPLTGAPAKVLWVKGSGGDLGSMKLDGFADALSRQAARPRSRLSRACARGRDGGAVQPLHVQPQSARDLDRHAAAWLRSPRACRSRSRRRGHRDRGERERRGADAARFWRQARLSAVAAAGLRSRPEARRDGARQIRTTRASCSAATACSPGGRPRRNATRRRSR